MRPLTPFSSAAPGWRGGAAGGELGDPPARLGHHVVGACHRAQG
jgi:hypothetical protein